MIIYVDTSAVGKLLVEEPESSALARYLDEMAARDDVVLVSAALLETELRRLADRTAASQLAVTEVLRRTTLLDVERGSFCEAGRMLPGSSLHSWMHCTSRWPCGSRPTNSSRTTSARRKLLSRWG